MKFCQGNQENKENHNENRCVQSKDETSRPRLPWHDHRLHFSWVKYLEHSQKATGQGKAAPLKLWHEPFPCTKNLFQPGMKLEGIDPQHQNLFCVLTVVDVMGHRVKLHFDGYSDVHDFWTNADSPNLFTVGWCERNNRLLSPPPRTLRFSWKSYLTHCNATAAPKQAFSTKKVFSDCTSSHNIRIGMKLEAEDRSNGWMCVATVKDVLENRLLIHFDGWDSAYDIWTDVNSPYVRPVGWCSENLLQLYVPKDYLNPESFNWPEYLVQTSSCAAPVRSFKTRPAKEFKVGMKLEVVDKRNPMLIRVATIVQVQSSQIKINFDGWDEMYDYWIEDDSPDIHPPSWCTKTGHPLQPPLDSAQTTDDSQGCAVKGCKGYGHIKGPIYTTHHTAFGCPYSIQNYNKEHELLIPDRIVVEPEKKSRKFSSKTVLLDLGTGDLDDEDSIKKRVRKRRRFFDEISAPESKSKLPKLSSDDKFSSEALDDGADASCKTRTAERPVGEALSLDAQVHQSVFSTSYVPVVTAAPSHSWRHLQHLLDPLADVDKQQVHLWTPQQVRTALLLPTNFIHCSKWLLHWSAKRRLGVRILEASYFLSVVQGYF